MEFVLELHKYLFMIYMKNMKFKGSILYNKIM